jgi:hypothetical protein
MIVSFLLAGFAVAARYIVARHEVLLLENAWLHLQ